MAERTNEKIEVTSVNAAVTSRFRHCRCVVVMAGHSRSKNGVASLAYVPAISIALAGSAA